MLLAEGVTMRAMHSDDWSFLVSLCDSEVAEQYERRGESSSPFSTLHLNLRSRMDGYLAEYIADWGNDHTKDDADSWAGDTTYVAKWGGSGVRRSVRLTLRVVPTHVDVDMAVDS